MNVISTLSRTILLCLILCAPVLFAADDNMAPRYGPANVPADADVTLLVGNVEKRINSPRPAFQSIQAAIDASIAFLRQKKSVKIVVGPGVYYETVRLNAKSASPAVRSTPLVIEGLEDDPAVISGLGAEGFEPSTWRKVRGRPNIYEHTWDQKYGLNWGPEPDRVGVLPSAALLRREMVVVEDQVLIQRELAGYRWVDEDGPLKIQEAGRVIRNPKTKPGQMVFSGLNPAGLGVLDRPWTFVVVDHDQAPKKLRNRIFIRLPDGMKLNSAVSLGISRLISTEDRKKQAGTSGDLLFGVTGKNNLVIRNISLRHAGTALYGVALNIQDVRGLLLENVQASHNNGNGLRLHKTTSFTVRDCRFEHNGHNGASIVYGSQNGRVIDSSFSFNQDRAYNEDYRAATQAGVKTLAGVKNLTFSKCVALGNRRGGFWTDANCSNTVYESCLSMGNGGFGFFLEWSGDKAEGDIVRQCVAAFNETGIRIGEVRRPLIENNLLVFNDQSFVVRNVPTRTPTTPEEIGYTRIVGNEVYSNPRSIVMRIVHGNNLLPTMQCRKNRYFFDLREKPFLIQGAKNKGSYDFRNWRVLLKANRSSSYRENGSVTRDIRAVGDRVSLFDQRSRVYRQASEYGVSLPEEAMQRALKRFAQMKNRNSAYADW